MVRRLSFVAFGALLAVAGAVAALRATDDPALPSVPSGFDIVVLAHVPDARELAFAPNGDLFAGTLGSDVYVLPDAEGAPGRPKVFVRMDDAPAAGIALAGGELFVGTQFGVWRIPYQNGDRTARRAPERIARVRPSGVSGAHVTTTVAVRGTQLFAGVGSSCNACDPDVDATRATVQEMKLDGSGMHPKAVHIRNPIALAVDPQTGSVWAGVAGQDELPHGHPYEIFDPITAHAGTVDYGWPHCYENHRKAEPGDDCSHQTPQRVVFPAYDTPIGAVFYPARQHGRYAFGSDYAGGFFVTLHGSWHTPPVPPRVAFVPMRGELPTTPVDWNDPATQWKEFVRGFQAEDGRRIGRPTGVAVGPEGSLFVADDKAGVIYRIRPRR
jgi:glucose/arabinose dehydrogenase